uniref:Ig-like domain-containing protein n=1 Tax=Rhabditophanes sp. KR3021 TaxID=114890 RepID=A0AC35TYK1_9BILA
MKFNSSDSNMLMFPTILCQLFNVCLKSKTPYFFPDTMQNISEQSKGEDIQISCMIGDIGNHMVAFIKSEIPPRLISFDDKIFKQREKYEIVPRVNGKEWILKIKNAQLDDSGRYICQINTDPVLTKIAYVNVKIPPAISRSSTPAAVEVREGHNVTLTCNADGNPKPRIVWRRADKQLIRFNGNSGYGSSVFNGSSLQLTKVSRKHMNEYVCVASNGIAPDESWSVKLLVTFPPIVLPQSPVVEASVGSYVQLGCTLESYPRGEFYFEFNGEPLYDSDRIKIEQINEERYTSLYILQIQHVAYADFGVYRCISSNEYGQQSGEIQLVEAPARGESNIITEGSAFPSEDDEDSFTVTSKPTNYISSGYIVTSVIQDNNSLSDGSVVPILYNYVPYPTSSSANSNTKGIQTKFFDYFLQINVFDLFKGMVLYSFCNVAFIS